ncbi:MAG: CYTH domain-containing protein [Clostridia bacterium]|nr:CYTH domain-containing protein [Clostridia bacterium]
MHIEFEERILEVDKDKMISKLESLGAIKKGEWFQKRYVYDFNPVRENEWIRLRTNGEVATLAYKNVEKNTVDGTKELEVEVSDFEETNELLNVLGYKAKGYQENKRVRYMLNGVEIDIDSWPMIPTYMEIEAESEEKVKEIEKLLEVDESKITALNCEDIYIQIYGINLKEQKDLRF